MASSGWQGEQWVHTVQAEVWLDGDLWIDGISHTADKLRVWGKYTLEAEGNSGWSCYFLDGVWAAAEGQGDAKILGNGEYLTVGSIKERSFDVTINNFDPNRTSYNFGVRYHANSYFDRTLTWSLSFDSYSTPPSGLTATLLGVGPDSADIQVDLVSWGYPTSSASRYIEGAVLGSSTYGAPYKYKTATAATSNIFHIDNTSGSGALTIVPNTQYHFGGFASNTKKNTSTVGGTFTTLPAVPIINAVDQGHGVIDVTVTHANEGSAETVTEEYSIDGGTTWNTITGGAFMLNLSAQTVLTVRRSSTIGASSDTVTITPSFTSAIYASVMNKTKLITKVYAPKALGAKRLVDLSCSSQPGDITLTLMDSDDFVEQFNSDQTLSDIVYYGDTLQEITVTFNFNSGTQETSYDFMFTFGQTREIVNDVDPAAWGFSTYGELADGDTGSVTVNGSYEDILQSKKIAKIYASVAGKTKLVFEDPS